MSRSIERVSSVLHRFAAERGEKTLSNGTRLVAHAPEIAPRAWLHLAFAAIDVSQIELVEQELRCPFPKQLIEFYGQFNGISMYGSEIVIWGARANYRRTGDDIWQPFDIVRHNSRLELPSNGPADAVYFGSTNRGEYWVFYECPDEVIGKTERRDFKRVQQWSDFDTWLLGELERCDSATGA